VIRLYAVCDASASTALGERLQRERLRTVRCGALAAVVADHSGAVPQPSEQNLWEHERVVESLLESCELLPARYGTVLAGDASARELLAARARAFEAALAKVSGRVELGVRARFSARFEELAHPLDSSHHAAGAAYMERLAARRRLAGELAGRIDASLSALATANTKRTLPSASQPMSGAYLVSRDTVERFRARVLALDAEICEAEIACTGPWPPYSFTGEGEEGADEI
jgi:hypothetical protein